MNAKPITLLALDTATSGCAVCVWQDGKVLASEAQTMARGQAEELMVMVDRVLGSAGVGPQALSGVAVTRGPGAFTGMRIALATAKGFALALGVPCVGVTTLEVLAAAVPDDERAGATVLACVESKRADIYVQLFSATLESLSEPQACDAEALAALVQGRVVLVGDAAERALEMLAGHDAVLSAAAPLPDAALIARIAAGRLQNHQEMPQPLYLRPPDAKLPKAQGRLRT